MRHERPALPDHGLRSTPSRLKSAQPAAKDATLQKLVDEASEPLGMLIGYLIG